MGKSRTWNCLSVSRKGQHTSDSRGSYTQTNNRAELTAFIEANRIIDERIDLDETRQRIIYTDCMLLVKMIQGGIKKRNLFGWKKTNNADLLKRIGEIVEQLGNKLTVIHVYSHTGGKDWKSK